jgi:3'-5' exoribonuclease
MEEIILENNNQHLLDIEKDEVFNGVLALRACSKRIKTNGEPYLSLELGDSSGRMPAVYWGNDAGAVFKEIESAMAVHVRGVISEYRDKPQFTVESIRAASQAEIDKAELLPVGSFSREQLENRLRSAIVTVENRFLRKLLDVIFGEADFRKAFLRAPAGKLWHGAYIGGLAEHSMNVAAICESAVPMFPLCRRDLLFACALLHDIGKVDEIQISEHFDYSIEGRLVGHIVIGERRIRAAIREIEDFPEEMALEISHMILSHHGEREMGSPVEPMTIEASILHHADLLESQANAFSHVVSRDLENAGPFSQWVDPVSRFLYKEAYNKGQST